MEDEANIPALDAEKALLIPGGIAIPRAELEARASRAGGAGGQPGQDFFTSLAR